MTIEFERRTLVEPVEFRSHEDGKLVAEGYAVKFNALSQNLGGFVERVAPGAFTKTIKEQNVLAMWDHDKAKLLGSVHAGTLRLEEDDTGLRYEVDLPDTTAGRDLAVLLERGDIAGSSFGFRAINPDWGTSDEGMPLRTVTAARLRDVGPTSMPAYTSSTSALRDLAESRSLDLDVVLAAAEADTLRSLLESAPDVNDRPPAIVHRRPAHWFV